MKINVLSQVSILLVAFVCGFFLAPDANAQSDSTAQTASEIQPSSGGNFTLTKFVIAGGGREIENASAFKTHATAGQAAAGRRMNGGQFSLYSGFWTPDSFQPTAARVSVSGRVATIGNRGLRKTVVKLIGGEYQTPIETTTNLRGQFVFTDIEVGNFYVITVERQGYSFEPDNYSFNLNEELSSIEFFARSQSVQTQSDEIQDEEAAPQ